MLLCFIPMGHGDVQVRAVLMYFDHFRNIDQKWLYRGDGCTEGMAVQRGWLYREESCCLVALAPGQAYTQQS